VAGSFTSLIADPLPVGRRGPKGADLSVTFLPGGNFSQLAKKVERRKRGKRIEREVSDRLPFLSVNNYHWDDLLILV
jgi:hypothetical protein